MVDDVLILPFVVFLMVLLVQLVISSLYFYGYLLSNPQAIRLHHNIVFAFGSHFESHPIVDMKHFTLYFCTNTFELLLIFLSVRCDDVLIRERNYHTP